MGHECVLDGNTFEGGQGLGLLKGLDVGGIPDVIVECLDVITCGLLGKGLPLLRRVRRYGLRGASAPPSTSTC